MDNYEIRKFNVSDLERVIEFFKSAYGEKTVFGSKEFLKWYFSSINNDGRFMERCIIGLDSGGKVISHYGGLDYQLKIAGAVIPIIWGVNAYTLPEWRGKGINSTIVGMINRDYDINGVIGFTDSTAKFYNSINYNVFEYKKFDRYVHIIDQEKTYRIIDALNQDKNIISSKLAGIKHTDINLPGIDIIRLDKNSLIDVEVDFEVDIYATTYRDRNFINRRVLNNPFVAYDVFGICKNNRLSSYIVIRKELLQPIGYHAYRIIDLFGAPGDCKELLGYSILEAKRQDCAYIEFSKFGSLFGTELIESGFLLLENDAAEVLPFCTSPVEFRKNNEHICFSSREFNDIINKMTKENVYFTRIDSDRDRLAKIDQVRL